MARPKPPRPQWIRKPSSAFGWLDARMLHQGWLARLGPEALAVVVLLALAADRHGASFYARERMAALLSLSREALDRALARLLELGLVEHRPWRKDHPDGVWQLMPLPPSESSSPRRGEPQSMNEILSRIQSEH